MASLFDPIGIRDVELRHRVCVSPMQQYVSDDAKMTDWHLAHLGSFAIGGAALVIAEVAAIVPDGRISPKDIGIWSDAFIEPFRRISQFVASFGAVPGIQIGHAGRRGATRPPFETSKALETIADPWELVAPSAIPFNAAYTGPLAVPRELTSDEIGELVDAFGAAAARALAGGFRWLEIHAAHGYLLHSFHSPLSNQRTDRYGGNLENRMRMTIEVVRAVRRQWPEELPLSLRISGTEHRDGGWMVEDSTELAIQANAAGVDVIVCSSGAGRRDRNAGAGYNVSISQEIRQNAGVLTGVVGMIRDPFQADEVIRNERSDLVFLAREMLRDPRWAIHAAERLGVNDVTLPLRYAHFL
jgi:2,4-dienoyl-CoA reductase-like NADH-dependent reductase (Old Yellow Enzyme family)